MRTHHHVYWTLRIGVFLDIEKTNYRDDINLFFRNYFIYRIPIS